MDAAEIEAEAEAYPEERGEILLDAAAAWRRAGDPARADALLRGLVAQGGENGAYARTELAEALFDEGRDAEAAAELAALARDPALHDRHCAAAADLLVARGDLAGALSWFDRYLARTSVETLDALRRPNGWLSLAAPTLARRRAVREQLGLPPDATDELVPRPPTEDDFARLLGRSSRRHETQVLFFTREERAEACRRWPRTYRPDDGYFADSERHWRELAEEGASRIRLYPASATGLAEFAAAAGLDPEDGAGRSAYLRSLPGSAALAWPPGRNAPCWCGSGRKYKKCCGAVR